MLKTSKSSEKMRDFTKKYFHLNSSAVYNSSAKKQERVQFQPLGKDGVPPCPGEDGYPPSVTRQDGYSPRPGRGCVWTSFPQEDFLVDFDFDGGLLLIGLHRLTLEDVKRDFRGRIFQRVQCLTNNCLLEILVASFRK